MGDRPAPFLREMASLAGAGVEHGCAKPLVAVPTSGTNRKGPIRIEPFLGQSASADRY